MECKDAITAYLLTAQALKDKLSDASINTEAFSQKLIQCSLLKCHGMCCYDGVYVSDETASMIEKLVEEDADFFKSIDLKLPEKVIVEGEWDNSKGLKTEVKNHDFIEKVEEYPSHFKNTTCVFQVKDGRCSLQMLSEHKGLHKWFYKPFACWLHPIDISIENSNGEITLHSAETDPNRLPEFDGYVSKTLCGKINECGSPAFEILDKELKYLGKIINRNLIEEIKI